MESKGQEMHREMPSVRETYPEPSDDRDSEECKCEEDLPESPFGDKNAPISSGEPKMKELGEVKKMKVLATILSQSTLWHELPIVRESGLLG